MILFPERLKELRNDSGLSRYELALKLNISTRLVCYWENGERECDFYTLIRIADLFDVTVDYLLGRKDY